MFTKDFFTQNRQRLYDASSTDVVVLFANGLVQKTADTTFPFQQDNNFWYTTGLDIADAIVVHECIKKTSFIILPKRLKHRDMWEGPINTVILVKQSGINEILNNHEGWQKLAALLGNSQSVGAILPKRSYEANYGMYINPAKIAHARKFKMLVKSSVITDCRPLLARLRSLKQPSELKAIQKAVDITKQSLDELRISIQSMRSEREAQVFLTNAFMKKGADGHAYDPIIASGKNATTIHYQDNIADFAKNQLLLLDVGASYNRYAADISRTWATSQNAVSGRQAAVHAAVKDVHTFAISRLKAGVLLREYEQEVRQYMDSHLTSLGLMQANHKKSSLKYFPHLTSHFLGLDVHDLGMYDEPLAENMVITVEPGIYIPQEGIGVRLEDDVVITKKGVKNLSKNIPLDLLY